MSSPFPGMDPYLERHWLDVHTKLVAYAAPCDPPLAEPDAARAGQLLRQAGRLP